MAGTRVPTRYPYEITEKEKFFRWVQVVLCAYVALLICTGLVWLFTDSYFWSVFIGVPLWCEVVGQSVRRRILMISVGDNTAAVTISQLIQATPSDPYKNQKVYRQGLSPKYFWERISDDLFIDLRIVPESFEEEVVCGEDHIVVKVKGILPYRPIVGLLPRYLAVSATTIRLHLVNLVTGLISAIASKHDSQWMRENIPYIQKALIGLYTGDVSGLPLDKDGRPLPLPPGLETIDAEERLVLETMGLPLTYQTMYGIDALPPAIGDSDFLNSWRKILEQEALMAKISADVTKLTKTADGKGLLSPEMASATVLTSYGLMKRNAFLLEGSAEQALTALIAAWAGLNKSE